MPRKNTTQRKPHLRLVTSKPQPESDRPEVRTPEGWRPSDDTAAAPFSDNTHAPEGLYEGDVAVIFYTEDVTPDELAVIREGEGLWFGKYRPAPGGYFTFERDGEVTRYRPGAASLAGRSKSSGARARAAGSGLNTPGS
jgi:hypothetical protein